MSGASQGSRRFGYVNVTLSQARRQTPSIQKKRMLSRTQHAATVTSRTSRKKEEPEMEKGIFERAKEGRGTVICSQPANVQRKQIT